MLGKIDQHKGARIGAVARRIGRQAGRVQYGEFGLEIVELARVRLQKHVAGEKRLPSVLADHPYPQPEIGVGAGVAILHEQLAIIEIIDDAAVQAFEIGPFERPVDIAPPDSVGSRGILDDEFIVGRAAGMLARQSDQRTVGGKQRFAAPHRLLAERWCARIPVRRPRALEPVHVETVTADMRSILLHPTPPTNDLIEGFAQTGQDHSQTANDISVARAISH